MKSKYILPIFLMGTVGLQSCSDFLDTEPTEGFPETVVWETQNTWMHLSLATMGMHTVCMSLFLLGTRLSATIW